MHMHIPLFRIWYSTTYTLLFFILIILLGVTPADTIYQSIRSNDIQKIFIVAGVYVLTFLITILIYATRLYTNRSVLAGIPKAYIPVENGEVGKMVRRMILKNLKRSAIIAWDSKPRDTRGEIQGDGRTGTRPSTAECAHPTFKRRSHAHDATVIHVSDSSPPWGHIAHPGWFSPATEDFPHLNFWSVILELPNLIEAKAVSLAPSDPALGTQLHTHDNTQVIPDAQAVALLQRPAAMGLRDYLGRLSSFGLINPPALGIKFLSQYEYARFSASALTEPEFRSLMSVFTGILSGMTELDPTLLAEIQAAESESETQSLALSDLSHSSTSSAVHYRTPRATAENNSAYARSTSSYSDRSGSPGTLRTAPSRARPVSSETQTIPRTLFNDSMGSVRIASVARNPSSGLPNSSSSSLRSAQSVVRLNPNPGPGELPYQFYVDGS